MTTTISKSLTSTGFDNATAAKDWSRDLTTITGFRFHIRPANPDDREVLASFFSGLGSEDVYFRFLTPLHKLDDWRLKAMTRIDDPQTIDFLAFAGADSQDLIATAMLSTDEGLRTAEVALATRSDMKHRGLSWALLDHLSRYAAAQGIETLRAVHSSADRDATGLEREAGFTVRVHPDDATLLLAEKALATRRSEAD